MATTATPELPEGFSVEKDNDGDLWLLPPQDVTIFSAPGEGWLITDDYMQGRDWNDRQHVAEACRLYLAEVSVQQVPA